jgi:hypothetical protein
MTSDHDLSFVQHADETGQREPGKVVLLLFDFTVYVAAFKMSRSVVVRQTVIFGMDHCILQVLQVPLPETTF